jgi:hypothetical protein
MKCWLVHFCMQCIQIMFINNFYHDCKIYCNNTQTFRDEQVTRTAGEDLCLISLGGLTTPSREIRDCSSGYQHTKFNNNSKLLKKNRREDRTITAVIEFIIDV